MVAKVKENQSGAQPYRLDYVYSAYKQYQKYCNIYSIKEKTSLDSFFELPCFDYRDVKSINACTNEIIVVSNDTESVHSIDYFRQYKNDKFYIIISADRWDPSKHNIGLSSYVNITFWFDIFDLLNRNLSFYNFEYWIDKEYNFDYPKNHNFCTLIGNKRPARDLFIQELQKTTNIANNIVKYSGEDYGKKIGLDIHSNKPGEFDAYSTITGTDYHNVSNTIPIELYNQAYFQIVVERDLDIENFAPTEKVYKCLLTGMPFVSVGSYKFLSNLRRLGFTTYNDLWDESYDDVYYYEDRIKKVCSTIKKLESFDWKKHRNKLEIIAAKNARNFLYCNTYFKKFFNDLQKLSLDLDLDKHKSGT